MHQHRFTGAFAVSGDRIGNGFGSRKRATRGVDQQHHPTGIAGLQRVQLVRDLVTVRTVLRAGSRRWRRS